MSMSPKARRTALAWLRQLAACASRAADASGCERRYTELRDTIIAQEKDHRRFGRHLVGRISMRLTIEQAADYFVAKTLADGVKLGEGPVTRLVGLRADFVQAAILMADERFRAAFEAEIAKVSEISDLPSMLRAAKSLDYCDFVGES